jgi:hypothetical protein
MLVTALFLLAAPHAQDAVSLDVVAGPDVTAQQADLFGGLVASELARRGLVVTAAPASRVVHVDLGRLGARYVANLRLDEARASATGPTMDAVVDALPAAVAQLTGSSSRGDPDLAVAGAVTAAVGAVASVGFYGGAFFLATLQGAPPSVTGKLLVPVVGPWLILGDSVTTHSGDEPEFLAAEAGAGALMAGAAAAPTAATSPNSSPPKPAPARSWPAPPPPSSSAPRSGS